MKRLSFLSVLLFCLLASPYRSTAAVLLGPDAETATTLSEVYVVDGIPYLSIDDILAALEVGGGWDSVRHVYRIQSAAGEVEFFPGGRYLKRGGRFLPLNHPARFIDGRLRVPEGFVTTTLPQLLAHPFHYRNLDPPRRTAREEGTVDRLFSFILRRKTTTDGPTLRAVAVDPGHGGQDTGVLGPDGVKEKDVVLGVARRVERQLKMRSGIPVYLSRDGDYDVTPPDRLAVAAREDVDAFLLLHAQSSFSPEHHGITMYVRPEDVLSEGEAVQGEPLVAERPRESLRLAHSLLAALRRAGFTVHAVQETPLLPLAQGDLPTVLIELGYLSHGAECTALLSEETQERLAGALVQGVRTFAELGREMQNR